MPTDAQSHDIKPARASTSDDYAAIIADVATVLRGEPNAKLSTQENLRFGAKGSLSIDTSRGVFHDHETGKGGGCLDLVCHLGEAADKRQAADWLKREGFLTDNAPKQPPAADSKRGKPSSVWTYTNRTGKPVLAVYRFEIDGQKTFIQKTPSWNGWVSKGLPKGSAYPLYGLHNLPADKATKVVITEGEKARDAAASMLADCFVTCWPGGSGKESNVDFSPLRDRHVILWPDHDEPGIKAMDSAADLLSELAASVAVVDVSGLPGKADAADVEAETAKRLIIDAQTIKTSGAVAFELESVGDLLVTPPPPRQYIIDQLLPLGVVGVLGAAGGTGKSFATLQLGVAIATGCDWLGERVSNPGYTLIFSAEDDRTEIHRRLYAIVSQHWPEGGDDAARQRAIKAISDRLFILDRVGEDNRLTGYVDRDLIRTQMADRVIATAEAMPEPPRLIILDPLARFDGGKPNEADDGTRLIETAEHIRKETGATVLLPHHVNKQSMRDPESGQEAIRGSSGIVDGARWVGLMATLRRDDAKKYGVHPENASRYVWFRTVGNNYGRQGEQIWLERAEGGVLVPTRLEDRKTTDTHERDEENHARILSGIYSLIRKHGRMSARTIRLEYGGKNGILAAGERAVRASINRAIDDGELLQFNQPGAKHKVLDLPQGLE